MYKLAFCTTVRDRFNSLICTLPSNIEKLPQNCCICVVDYGSKSDAGERWLLEQYSSEVRSGRLIVFRVNNDLDWSAPKAKNLAHRLVSSEYMFNLDCDNFISDQDVSCILNMASEKLPCQQFCPEAQGSYGRIGVPSETFYHLGGYDEGMLPMGYQDVDFWVRATQYHGMRGEIGWSSAHLPLDIDKPKLFAFGMDDNVFEEMNVLNQKRSLLRRQISGIVIKDSFSSYRGRLNGNEVTFDGFGKFTSNAFP